MARTPDREYVAPVQRFRIRYAKRGRLRFTSHRDFQRALERALRRARVPMAYSAGFTPHPKISYANTAPTGTASEAEYVEIGVAQMCDPERLRIALDEALPPGLDVIEVIEAHTGDFVARLEASEWQIVLRGVTVPQAKEAVEAFLAADEVLVERLMKSGMRTFDARAAVLGIDVSDSRSDLGYGSDCAILHMVVRHLTPAVRPDDVLAALRQVANLVPPVPELVTRLAQGPLTADARSVGDPFAPDRAEIVAGA